MTQPDRPDLDWLRQLVEEVIILAMDGHAEQVCDRLETIGQRGGHIGPAKDLAPTVAIEHLIRGADEIAYWIRSGEPVDAQPEPAGSAT